MITLTQYIMAVAQIAALFGLVAISFIQPPDGFRVEDGSRVCGNSTYWCTEDNEENDCVNCSERDRSWHNKNVPNIIDESLDKNQNIKELGDNFEGDVMLYPRRRSALNNCIDLEYHWPNRTVPYTIDTVYAKEQADFINATLDEFNKRTCIRVRPAEPSDTKYVQIIGTMEGCWSLGPQVMNLEPVVPHSGCFVEGTILHVFLHALGFYNEQSAADTDEYDRIVWDNIESATRSGDWPEAGFQRG